MSVKARRRRAFLLLSLALACGGFAASEVGSRMRAVEAAVGPRVPVLVAARDIAPGGELDRGDLAVREVPARFAPPDALAVPREALGLPVATPLTRGSYLTQATFTSGGGEGDRRPGTLRRGERAVEVAVAGDGALGEAGAPGARVDVLVSTEPGEGAARTLLALENVELLDLRGGGAGSAVGAGAEGGEGAAATASGTATLRVTLRQAVYLTAAQNFAREVRLLPRPAGDRGRAGPTTVPAEAL